MLVIFGKALTVKVPPVAVDELSTFFTVTVWVLVEALLLVITFTVSCEALLRVTEFTVIELLPVPENVTFSLGQFPILKLVPVIMRSPLKPAATLSEPVLFVSVDEIDRGVIAA